MNENAAFLGLFVAVATVVSIVVVCAMLNDNAQESTKQEAIKAGLVQKIENGQPIWTKP